ncbi:MAG: LicD family protein [Clostridia bacterium]|nr:LicD family protein [Clostridia bacterium]
MQKVFLEDELAAVVDSYAKFTSRYMHPPKLHGISKKGRFLYEKAYVISDSNSLGRFMLPAFVSIKRKKKLPTVRAFSVADGFALYDDFDYTEYEPESLENLFELPKSKKTAFMLCIDCEKVDSHEEWLKTIRRVAEFSSKGRKNMCIISLMLPEHPAIPDAEITSLSEREFSFFMEKRVKNHTKAQKFFLDVEALCRTLVNEGIENINISRVDNLFGPGCNDMREFDIEAFVKDAFEKGEVTVDSQDYAHNFTCTYLRDAFNFAVQALYCGRQGHVYNFISHVVSKALIKTTIHECFKKELALKINCDKVENETSSCLNTLKLFQSGWKAGKIVPLQAALYHTVLNITNGEHDNNKNIAVYAGKLTRIKDLELMMLKDIDELCKKHGINYFLCGGTMLGAVRYGHSIPWDDDLDIGMLRKDFDKFREVSMKEQKGIYNYSSHWCKSGAHYIVDKVRLNGTYFSTKYSSIHEYQDGLFIDVLVYDQTSNIRWIGKLHSRILHTLSKMIEVRWYERPRRGKNFRKEMLILPFLRIFPTDFYHKIYEWLLVRYKNKKNAKYVIDSTGKLQKKGPFSIYGLEEIQRVDFDGGFKAPIPMDYTNYLTFDYGPNYLPEPVLSKRAAPHNFARIDLGGYIFDTEEGKNYRDVDVRGELFEKDC